MASADAGRKQRSTGGNGRSLTAAREADASFPRGQMISWERLGKSNATSLLDKRSQRIGNCIASLEIGKIFSTFNGNTGVWYNATGSIFFGFIFAAGLRKIGAESN